MKRFVAFVLSLLGGVTSACGGGGGVMGAAGTNGAARDGAGPDSGVCVPIEAHPPDEGAQHAMTCLPPPTYRSRPPSSGNHYQAWADFRTYDTPVPWGHLVHAMEHGAIVIVYNCPGGCPDQVARAQAMIDALPVDPACVAPTKRRVILAPDPTLDVRWAAAAWTWTLRSPCFDEVAFRAFATAHYDKASESFCTELHEPFCAMP